MLRAAVGLQSAHAPQWVFFAAEADLSGIGRTAAHIDTGVTVDPLIFDVTGLAMTGILLGSVQEYARG